MIAYDTKSWRRVIFSYRGTVLPRVVKRVAFYALFTLGFLLWDGHVTTLPHVDPLGHSLVGVALGLLIVFRTNTSYDRFWEGRKLWGTMSSAARNLVRGATAYGGSGDDLARLTAAYARALKQQLRGNPDLTEIKTLLPTEVFAHVAATANPPLALTYYLSAAVQKRLADQTLDTATGRTLETCICTMVDSQVGCERIVRTPIPFAYAAHIKQLLMVYLATLPSVLVPKMGWPAVLAVAGITFALVGIEEAGVEIEDPFGEDPNDLPLDEFCDRIDEDTADLAKLPGR